MVNSRPEIREEDEIHPLVSYFSLDPTYGYVLDCRRGYQGTKNLSDCRRFFLEPLHPKQRQYEALRSYFVDEEPSSDVAAHFGYTPSSFRVLCHQLRRDPHPPSSSTLGTVPSLNPRSPPPGT